MELKKDFSNIHDVLKKIKDDRRRSGMVEQAFKDIVLSWRYTYRNFVRYIIEQSLKDRDHRVKSISRRIRERGVYFRMYVVELCEQFWMRLLSPVNPLIVRFFRN